MYTTLGGASTLIGKYFIPYPPPIPNIYGHPAADSAIAVAAYALQLETGPALSAAIRQF
jgi:hypothetical protein